MDNKSKDYETLAEMFRANGHPDRLAILDLLCNCGSKRLTVKSIYEKLDLDQPSASRHLSIMRNSGVLEREQEAGNTYYSLRKNDPNAERLLSCFGRKTKS